MRQGFKANSRVVKRWEQAQAAGGWNSPSGFHLAAVYSALEVLGNVKKWPGFQTMEAAAGATAFMCFFFFAFFVSGGSRRPNRSLLHTWLYRNKWLFAVGRYTHALTTLWLLPPVRLVARPPSVRPPAMQPAHLPLYSNPHQLSELLLSSTTVELYQPHYKSTPDPWNFYANTEPSSSLCTQYTCIMYMCYYQKSPFLNNLSHKKTKQKSRCIERHAFTCLQSIHTHVFCPEKGDISIAYVT